MTGGLSLDLQVQSGDFIAINFCVAYTKCAATLWHENRIYLFVHWSRASVTWSSKPHMYALRTYFLSLQPTVVTAHRARREW